MLKTPAAPTATKRLVLVADDEPAMQKLLTRVIQQLGLAALCVGDGAAAVAAVAAQPDRMIFVLMDIVMPIMNGVDAARAIQLAVPRLPIVLMSGGIPAGYAEQIMQLQLAGLLDKPFPIATVRTLLRNAVSDSAALEKDSLYERQC